MKSWFLYVSTESNLAGFFFFSAQSKWTPAIKDAAYSKVIYEKTNRWPFRWKKIVPLIKYSTNYYILSAIRFERHTFWPTNSDIVFFLLLIKLPYSNLYNLFNGPEMKKKHFKWVHQIYSKTTGKNQRYNRVLVNESQFNKDYVTSGWKRE